MKPKAVLLKEVSIIKSQSKKIYKHNLPFTLESGETLSNIEIAYHTYGTFDPNKNNVIWVCHAFTADSDVFEWWSGIFGEDKLFNPKEHFIICANNLGSCYGTTGPTSINPQTNKPYFSSFPNITIRDIANVHDLLREELGIKKIHTIIGGSQGAQQILEWNILKPDLFDYSVVMATNAKHSPWGIAFSESQRLAIYADATYYNDTINGGEKGLAVARSIALLSYRNYQTYSITQREKEDSKTDNFLASSYQRYQGEKLVNRFDAYSYVTITKSMDSHNVARGRGSIKNALNAIKSKVLVVAISSDILFPPEEQLEIANYINDSSYSVIDSLYGHDGFLIETEKLSQLIRDFYFNTEIIDKTQVNSNSIKLVVNSN